MGIGQHILKCLIGRRTEHKKTHGDTSCFTSNSTVGVQHILQILKNFCATNELVSSNVWHHDKL